MLLLSQICVSVSVFWLNDDATSTGFFQFWHLIKSTLMSQLYTTVLPFLFDFHMGRI